MTEPTSQLRYHPSYESREYTQSEYSAVLSNMAKKETAIVNVDHSLAGTSISRIMKIWQSIKGWFGFENITDPIKVDYELLKFIRYGNDHNLLSDSSAKKLVEDLQKKLSEDNEHTEAAKVLDKIARLNSNEQTKALDKEIHEYHNAHKAHLHDAFWPSLFSSSTSQLNTATSFYQYNLGRIHADEGRFDQAIEALERALQIEPNRMDCNLLLATVAASHVYELVEQGDLNNAQKCCTKAFAALALLPPAMQPQNAQMELYIIQSAIQVKQNTFTPNYPIINAIDDFDYEEFAQAVEQHFADYPTLLPTDLQKGVLYLTLAQQYQNLDEDSPELQAETYARFLESAVENLQKAPTDDAKKKHLTEAYKLLAEYFADQEDNEKAIEILEKLQALSHSAEIAERIQTLTRQEEEEPQPPTAANEPVATHTPIEEPPAQEPLPPTLSASERQYQLAENFSRQGKWIEAETHYKEALRQDPGNNSYRQKSEAATLNAASVYYHRGLNDPKHLRQQTLDLIRLACDSSKPHAKKIEKALGAWYTLANIIPPVYKRFTRLAQSEKTSLKDLERDAIRACDLLEKAYDGEKNHMKPEAMPNELRQKVNALRQQVANIRFYYEKLPKETEILVAAAKRAGYGEPFKKWKTVEYKPDLSTVPQIEEQAERALTLIEAARAKKGDSLPRDLANQVEAMKVVRSPGIWQQQAIERYVQMFESEQPYGEWCSLLIDSFIQIGNYSRALGWHQAITRKFPDQNIAIDPRVYAGLIDNPKQRGTLNNNALYNGLMSAIEQRIQQSQANLRNFTPSDRHQNNLELNKLYSHALLVATTPTQCRVVLDKMFPILYAFIDSQNFELCMSSLDAFEFITPHLDKLQGAKDAAQQEILNMVALISTHSKKWTPEQVLQFSPRALQLNPRNASIISGLAQAHYKNNDFEKAREEYIRALALDHTNRETLEAIYNTEIEIGNQYYVKAAAENVRQSLIELTTFVQTSPDDPALAAALKPWNPLTRSSEYTRLAQLGRAPNSSLTQIINETQTAIQTINKAYNRIKATHQIPAPLKERLDILSKQVDDLRTISENLPQMPSPLNKSGNSTLDFSRIAIEHYTSAQKLHPERFHAYPNLANLYLLAGNSVAFSELSKMVKSQFPSYSLTINVDYCLALCRKLAGEQKLKEVLSLLQTALEIHPNNAVLVKAKGEFYLAIANDQLAKGKKGAAAQAIEKAIEIGISVPTTYYHQLRDIYFEVADKGIHLLNGKPIARLEHDDTHNTKAYLTKAAQYGKKAVELDPTNADAHCEYGRILMECNVFEVEDFKKINFMEEFEKAYQLDINSLRYAYAYRQGLVHILQTQVPFFDHNYTRNDLESAGRDITDLGGDYLDSEWPPRTPKL